MRARVCGSRGGVGGRKNERLLYTANIPITYFRMRSTFGTHLSHVKRKRTHKMTFSKYLTGK